MVIKNNRGIGLLCFLILGMVLFSQAEQAVEKKAMTMQDVMQFKHIRRPVISEDGGWLAYGLQPDRGDGEACIQGLGSDKAITIPRGADPVISKDSRWVGAVVKPPASELDKSGKDKPKPGMALVEIQSGEIKPFEKVERFAFSDDSSWLAYLHFKPEEKEDTGEKEEKGDRPKVDVGAPLVLLNLKSREEIQIPSVLSFAFDRSSRYLAYVLAEPQGVNNGLYFVELNREGWARKFIRKIENGRFSGLTWSREGSRLAFVEASGKGKALTASLWIWDGMTGKAMEAVPAASVPAEWILPEKNELTWTEDGQRLFFGFKPEEFMEAEEKEKEADAEIDLFDMGGILEKREVDVWHWNDPFINSHQKILWPKVKDQLYRAVFHLASKRVVQLADRDMPEIDIAENPEYVLGKSDVPYRKEVTWIGPQEDIYLVSLKNGSRRKVASRMEGRCAMSPGGRYVVFYQDKNWHLYDGRTETVSSLTGKMTVPFYNEDHDYPSSVPSYGIAGWMQDDKTVLIYDKYDIWMFPVRGGEPVNLTAGKGRKEDTTFRIVQTDPEFKFFTPGEELLLHSNHNLKKNDGFYGAVCGRPGVTPRLEDKKKFTFLAKAKRADSMIFTRETYQEFPDIWISDLKLQSPRKVTDVNPQIDTFAWGEAELVEWKSVDGVPLQGILIKPGNYEPGKRYPVLIYYYRFFSQRLYEFNQVVVNHRPCFPFYASNGYALFLPDIRFDIGHPGYAATKCLVPGVQKLVDMGVADPKGLCLHGHSWSGYQTAFVITQTNLFTCAVAGAPVSNMTSAYSGIRWGTGLARQFQYEKTQSRLGGSLWEYPERYIENSPVFFADRIQTPLLIMFGDEDGAVPWYQGIELYLAMRRLEKDCVFLQYRGEPHHPQKYANKLDYAIKMKEYMDHYCKGLPAPEWLSDGIPYRGH